MPEEIVLTRILVAVDGSEIVFPVLNDELNEFVSFLGINTARTYDTARLRADQDMSTLNARIMRLSNWPDIARWFCLTEQQAQQVSITVCTWMMTASGLLHERGYADEALVTLGDINATL